MPWLTIIMFLLSYFASRANGASAGKALVGASFAAAGTYYVTHETAWGKDNLGELDGLGSATTSEQLDANGQPIPNGAGGTVKTVVDGASDVLKSWGAVGTSGVLATTAAVSGGLFSSENMKYWLIGGGLLFLALSSK